MKELNRTVLGRFTINQAINIEEVSKKNIISIEEFFKDKNQVVLNNSKLIHFLNGVKITQKENDGIYRIYNEKMEFIGLGIIEKSLLKRDIILKELV